MPLLSPLDSSALHEEGLLRRGNREGSHRLHKRRLNRSSDEEHRDIPLVIPPDSPGINDAFVTIPIVLISRETLIYVGLSDTKGDELWNRWLNFSPDDASLRETDGGDLTFVDFILGYYEYGPDAVGDNDDAWYACLDTCGIASETQAALMDPHFAYLRRSQSCSYWVRDTIEMRYAGLEDIQRASRDREMALQRAAMRPGGSSSSSLAPSGERRSISGLQHRNMTGIIDVWGSARFLAAQNAPGHTVLYKALDQARIAGLFDDQGNLVEIDTLLSSYPSDFSGKAGLFYFTPNYNVALYYARYAKNRLRGGSVVMVVLHVPNAAIQSLSPPKIRHITWPSNDWKELVWGSRTRKKPPSHLRIWEDSILVIGSTARKPDLSFRALESWEYVTEDFLLKAGPGGFLESNATIATQYVINGSDSGSDWLIQNGGRSLLVFTYPSSDLTRWLAENPSL
ncbi:hypothetical protein B0T25DRAFT_442534 [Lasiosphaeria hispida]|uniref:Uncharacterized protein n=1 Tax=Lasiosphaeria hispida TaxID=260671 RepID=A0AAJ0HX44_9PEZI|nr:hypothetical protein B0T25DRAFT_442534 [Lasiosphaeria hispida]